MAGVAVTGDNLLILAENNTRNATVCVGGASDDAVQIDAFGVAREAAADTLGTFTAWVNMPDITGTYAIVSCADASAVETFTLGIENGTLYAYMDIAANIAWDINSTAVAITAHKWHHVAFVQNGTRIIMYADGEAVAMTDTDITEATYWFAQLPNCDSGSIGATDSAGGAAGLTNEFKGGISDVKYWNVALTASQVRQDYLGIPNTTDLISHWDMKDDWVDNTSAHSGTAVGDVFLSNGYGELASRIKKAGVVVADDVTLSQQNMEIVGALIIKA